MSDRQVLTELETLFLALADGTRLRLLNLMRENEVCVCVFTEILAESQPKISRHLAYLRNAGIVSARRDGKWMHYKIVIPEERIAAQILRNTLESIKANALMRADFEKMLTVCDAASPLTTISRAPRLNVSAKTNLRRNQTDVLETFLL